jgi:hypothetical protein
MRPFLQGRKNIGEALQAPVVKTVLPLAGVTVPAHPASGPSVEVVKEGEKVVRLIVTCGCGERTEVECIYRAGA